MKTRAERIADVVTMMGEAWRQKITPATMLTFSAGTEDILIDDVERGAVRSIRECQFMPSVFELRQLCGTKPDSVSPKDRPTLAWCDVRTAIRKVGGYESPKFDDPVINATIREMGGWVALCDSTSDELVWREKDFLRIYAALATCRLPDERTERLTGIIEKTNGAPTDVVEVGCLTVGTSAVRRIEVEQPKKRLTATLSPVAELAKRLTFGGVADEEAREHKPIVAVRSREEQIAALGLPITARSVVSDELAREVAGVMTREAESRHRQETSGRSVPIAEALNV